jgi:dihydrofolate synthase/folylpolyglutamate synthase
LDKLNGYLQSIQKAGLKLELNRIKSILKVLGDPQNNFKTILVAGTNGKGSVSTFLNNILVKTGFRTGLFTSPHLISVNERIRVDNKKIDNCELESIVFYIKQIVDKELAKGNLPNPLTFFETMTIAAFLFFSKKKVDWGVLEIGLGGRLDATNVVNPELSIITTISYDHTRILGNTLTMIAKEKAGIIKKGKSIVVGRLPYHVLDVIKKISQEREAKLVKAFDRDNRLKEYKGGKYHYITPIGEYFFKPKLKGKHQGENAAVAIKGFETLNIKDANKNNIIEGVENAFIEGRLEVFNKKLIFDGAHNIDGIKRLTEFLIQKNYKNLYCVFGASKGKKIKKMGELLFPLCKKIIITKAEIYRAEEPVIIKEELKKFNDKIEIEFELLKAVKRIINEAGNGKILITGSLYLVGDVKKIIKEHGIKI